MALLDAPQAMYGSMSSPYLIQSPYSRGYYRDYEQETIAARFNIQQRLHTSPEYSRAVKEEVVGTAFKPYQTSPPGLSSNSPPTPGQENILQQAHNNKVRQIRQTRHKRHTRHTRHRGRIVGCLGVS